MGLNIARPQSDLKFQQELLAEILYIRLTKSNAAHRFKVKNRKGY